jgi:hypothetical protein
VIPSHLPHEQSLHAVPVHPVQSGSLPELLEVDEVLLVELVEDPPVLSPEVLPWLALGVSQAPPWQTSEP